MPADNMGMMQDDLAEIAELRQLHELLDRFAASQPANLNRGYSIEFYDGAWRINHINISYVGHMREIRSGASITDALLAFFRTDDEQSKAERIHVLEEELRMLKNEEPVEEKSILDQPPCPYCGGAEINVSVTGTPLDAVCRRCEGRWDIITPETVEYWRGLLERCETIKGLRELIHVFGFEYSEIATQKSDQHAIISVYTHKGKIAYQTEARIPGGLFTPKRHALAAFEKVFGDPKKESGA